MISAAPPGEEHHGRKTHEALLSGDIGSPGAEFSFLFIHTGRTSALISLYWIEQTMLGFPSSHKLGFTKVSDGQKYLVCYSDYFRIISPTHETRRIKSKAKVLCDCFFSRKEINN